MFLINYNFWTLLLAGVASSADLYIQDYPLFTALVPCAADALSDPVNSLTASKCPDDPAGLQSCACTKDTNSASVLSDISTTMGYSCGSGAVEDLKSASALFSMYCNPAANTALTTPAPNSNAVSDYIWDLSAYSELAGCAADALSDAVGTMTASLCHSDPAALASCVCIKNANSRFVSSKIKTTIGYSCGTTASDDLKSALAIYDGYCQLGAGITKFPTRTPLAGLVTYNIWDLPEYSKLVSCAAEALSEKVASLTHSECPPGPRELVSCACMKDRKSSDLSRDLVTTVGYSCGTDAKEDVTSAQAVFAYYCSAGKGLVTPQGITAVASATDSALNSGSDSPGETSKGSGEMPNETSSGTSGSPSSPSETENSSGNGKKSSNVGAIAGGVVGGLAVLILAGIAIWRYRRKHLKPSVEEFVPAPQPYDHSKPELGGTEAAAMPVKTSISRKPAPTAYDERPISPIDDKKSPNKQTAEIYTPPGGVAYRAEVPGAPNMHEMSNDRPHQEMYGSQHHPVEAPALSANMNQGPYYEMDGRGYRH